MAWTQPRTWVTGELVTASIGNQEWRDNMLVVTPAGGIIGYGNKTAPSGWLPCDGAAVSRTTYAALYAAIVTSLGTVTVTIASPGVFTRVAHDMAVDDAIFLSTTGALPTGLAANTTYYVVSVPSADTFTVSATKGGAAINTSGTQSGTHTLYFAPYGVAGSATTFNVPDMRGRVLAGLGSHADVSTLTENEGAALADRSPSHHHLYDKNVEAAMAAGAVSVERNAPSNNTKTSGNANLADKPAYGVALYIIKT